MLGRRNRPRLLGRCPGPQSRWWPWAASQRGHPLPSRCSGLSAVSWQKTPFCPAPPSAPRAQASPPPAASGCGHCGRSRGGAGGPAPHRAGGAEPPGEPPAGLWQPSSGSCATEVSARHRFWLGIGPLFSFHYILLIKSTGSVCFPTSCLTRPLSGLGDSAGRGAGLDAAVRAAEARGAGQGPPSPSPWPQRRSPRGQKPSAVTRALLQRGGGPAAAAGQRDHGGEPAARPRAPPPSHPQHSITFRLGQEHLLGVHRTLCDLLRHCLV